MGNDEVDLWATDEVHFQQHGSRCRMWVPPETKDPVLLHHPTRRGIGYFGAVRLRDGKFRFVRETGKFNAMSFFAFMKILRLASIRTRRRVVVIADNARYHHARLHKEWRGEPCRGFQTGISATLQSRTESDRAGLETGTSTVYPQSILSHAAGSRHNRGNSVWILGQRK